MSDKFDKFLKTFRSHVIENASVISAQGVPLTGAVYVNLVNDIIGKINDGGSIPKIEDSWTLLSKVQNAETEARVRRDVLAKSEQDCPLGDDTTVFDWVRGVVTASVFPPEQWMSPRPNLTALAESIGEEVFRHCKALGRVRDEAAIAREQTKEALASWKEAWEVDTLKEVVADGSQLLRATLCTGIVELLPLLVTASVQRGRTTGHEEAEMRIRTVEAERDHLCAELDKEKENNRFPHAPVQREDACVGPDEGIESIDTRDGAGNEVAGEEELRTGSVQDEGEHVLKDLEVTLWDANERVKIAETKLEQCLERETTMRQTFEDNMEILREESVARIEAARRQREDAEERAKTSDAQSQVLRVECERLRALAREAQEKAVEMHRTTLEDLKARDGESRSQMEAQRREWADLQARAETSALESRSLKRRVDELLPVEEAKRLRAHTQEMRVLQAKDETERESLRTQLQNARADNDSLRRTNVELESRLAVAEATVKLDHCRRSMA